jgi:hypothetical protein
MERLRKQPFKVPETSEAVTTKVNSLVKWIPLVCAGAAAGVSIMAFQEIKNIRKDMTAMKKEQNNPLSEECLNLNKRIENIESQMKIIANFVKNKEEPKVVKNVVKQEPTPSVTTIINEDEYEEVEVTDDEPDD